MFLCLALLPLCGVLSPACLADMNPSKPIDAKPYVPRIPKIIPSSRVRSQYALKNPTVPRSQKAGRKPAAIAARKAWQQRLSNQFSQASQAGTVSTLLGPH
jgi:hypothetical protein